MTEYVLDITTGLLSNFVNYRVQEDCRYYFKIDKKGNVLVQIQIIKWHYNFYNYGHDIDRKRVEEYGPIKTLYEMNDNIPVPPLIIEILNNLLLLGEDVNKYNKYKGIEKLFKTIKETLQEEKKMELISSFDTSLPFQVSLEEEVINLKKEITKLKQQNKLVYNEEFEIYEKEN